MGKKGAKEYIKLCQSYNTIFEGYKVPVGALYGRTFVPYRDVTGMKSEYIFWMCKDFQKIKSGRLSVYIMKREWNNNSTCHVRNITWHKIAVGTSHPVFKQVYQYCLNIGYIPKVGSFKNPCIESYRKEKQIHSVSQQYGLRKHPQPTMRCYKQAMVDGKGYEISWEENVQPLDGYNGLPVEYNNNTPKIAFTAFEGITDTDAFKRRDGMKVKQTSIRPQKQTTNNTKLIIRVNGVVKNV